MVFLATIFLYYAKDAEWSSTNTDAVNISNTPGLKGQMTTGAESGMAIIEARYDGGLARKEIRVNPAPLEVMCVPDQKEVAVGETVRWVSL